MNSRSPDTDVLIAGGGIVGTVLAGLLGRAGVDCILVDSAATAPDPVTAISDPRALALTPASRSILEAFGVWPHVPRDRIGEFRRMQVWDENGSGRIEFDSAEICEPTLGYIIEQPLVQAAIDRSLNAWRNIATIRPVRPEAIEWNADSLVLRMNDGRRFSARLLVAADGARSRVRELAGIGYAIHDYRQSALACVVQTSVPHAYTARQRFLAGGPLAFLPLHDQHACGVVWSLDRDRAGELAAMDTGGFHALLAETFESVAGEIKDSGPRVVFPLSRAHAERYCRGRFVLVGDAAHCVHPLAGQGANLGILDAAALAEVLLEDRARGRDIGDMQTLRRYARWRRAENTLMLIVLDGLKKLFETQAEPLPRLRNFGLDLVHASGPVKFAIMRRAMGIEGDVPALARARFEH